METLNSKPEIAGWEWVGNRLVKKDPEVVIWSIRYDRTARQVIEEGKRETQ